MTVAELISELQKKPPEYKVVVAVWDEWREKNDFVTISEVYDEDGEVELML